MKLLLSFILFYSVAFAQVEKKSDPFETLPQKEAIILAKESQQQLQNLQQKQLVDQTNKIKNSGMDIQKRDLHTLQSRESGIGGAGNGGGQLAMSIAKKINDVVKALYPDLNPLDLKYKLYVGKYESLNPGYFCPGKYFPEERAILIDSASWLAMYPAFELYYIQLLVKTMVLHDQL